MPKRKAPPEKGHAIAETSGAGSDDHVPNKKKLAAAEADGKASSDTEGNTTSISQDEPPPYGSQEYWENRYAESASAGHSWYFTYDELRPLLLPLLLGRDGADASADDEDDDDGDEWEEVGDDDDDEEEAAEGEINDHEENEDEEDEGTKDHSPRAGGGNGSNSGDDDDDNDGAPHAKEEHLPKSVLEVGCGDVPLGHPLLLDLLSMQKDTGADANLVVKEIVCNDYAKSVIDALREQQKEHWLAGGVKGSYESADGRDGRKIERLALNKAIKGEKDPTDKPTLDVTYVVEDARDMAYKDETFDLIIDKGTTDALLSDKEEGISNCVKVISEMGRCATLGGFIMVISHMNAHCEAGIDWCNRVLVAGLRASQAVASWEIEVHGNDGGSDATQDVDDEKDYEKDDDEEGNNDDPPSGSPGPAVYIIHKRIPKQEAEKTNDADSGSKDENEEAVIDTIPLKFFTY